MASGIAELYPSSSEDSYEMDCFSELADGAKGRISKGKQREAKSTDSIKTTHPTQLSRSSRIPVPAHRLKNPEQTKDRKLPEAVHNPASPQIPSLTVMPPPKTKADAQGQEATAHFTSQPKEDRTERMAGNLDHHINMDNGGASPQAASSSSRHPSLPDQRTERQQSFYLYTTQYDYIRSLESEIRQLKAEIVHKDRILENVNDRAARLHDQTFQDLYKQFAYIRVLEERDRSHQAESIELRLQLATLRKDSETTRQTQDFNAFQTDFRFYFNQILEQNSQIIELAKDSADSRARIVAECKKVKDNTQVLIYQAAELQDQFSLYEEQEQVAQNHEPETYFGELFSESEDPESTGTKCQGWPMQRSETWEERSIFSGRGGSSSYWAPGNYITEDYCNTIW